MVKRWSAGQSPTISVPPLTFDGSMLCSVRHSGIVPHLAAAAGQWGERCASATTLSCARMKEADHAQTASGWNVLIALCAV
mmetsp:Transcript_11307/g.26005  ORF Transcript_11307/g.26005 Transcript_11307/m.26005 type:complete len:81 (-) Transcript_11307:281-523(-)